MKISSAAKAPFLVRFKMRYCGVEKVERIALDAYQNSPIETENISSSHGHHHHHKGHHRRSSKSKNILNLSPSHSTSSPSQEASPMLTKLAKDNFAGGAGSCTETISWKAAIFKVFQIQQHFSNV